jgi:hypothetical protein
MGRAPFSNKKGIKEAKEAAGAMQYASGLGLEAVSAYQAQVMAAEMAKFQVYSALGAPGTYGPGAAAASAANPATGSVYDTTSTLATPDQGLKQSMPYATGKKGLLGTPRQGILDPEAYAAKIMGSSSFRTQSALQAEAEQLANREGDLYNKLENSILGVINEGAALQLREVMREIRTQGARTTTGARGPRNAAMQDARYINAMENAMRTRVQAGWQAALGFQQTVWDQIQKVQAGSVEFLDNLPMVNKQYMDTLAKTVDMQVAAGEMAAKISQNAYAVKQSQQAVDFGASFVEALTSFAGSYIAGKIQDEPVEFMKDVAGGIKSGVDYTKGLFQREVVDAQGNPVGMTEGEFMNSPLQGPATPEGEPPRELFSGSIQPLGTKWSKIFGWNN